MPFVGCFRFAQKHLRKVPAAGANGLTELEREFTGSGKPNPTPWPPKGVKANFRDLRLI